MKILVLNPYLNAEHDIIVFLQQKGLSTLVASSPEEAWQLLQLYHDSVSLIVVHREGLEGKDEAGLEFVKKFRQNGFPELPYLLTTEKWSNADCAVHQETDFGANAYCQSPFNEKQLFELIREVTDFDSDVTSERERNPAHPPPPPPSGQAEVDSYGFGVSAGSYELSDVKIEEPSHSEELTTIKGADLNSLEISELVPEDVVADLPEKAAPLPLESEKVESEVRSHFPYLDGEHRSTHYQPPLGDAVVPGGASESPDLETLKKYLMLREQDVATLSAHLQAAREQVESLETEVTDQRSKNDQLEYELKKQEEHLGSLKKEKEVHVESLEKTIEDLKSQLEVRSRQARVLKEKIEETLKERESIRQRIREDLQKIRRRERELENRLDIVRRDSEALLHSRENKIVELKRKVDLLEFNMELLQEQFDQEHSHKSELEDKLRKAAQAMKVAGGLLGEEANEQVARAEEPAGATAILDIKE